MTAHVPLLGFDRLPARFRDVARIASDKTWSSRLLHLDDLEMKAIRRTGASRTQPSWRSRPGATRCWSATRSAPARFYRAIARGAGPGRSRREPLAEGRSASLVTVRVRRRASDRSMAAGASAPPRAPVISPPARESAAIADGSRPHGAARVKPALVCPAALVGDRPGPAKPHKASAPQGWRQVDPRGGLRHPSGALRIYEEQPVQFADERRGAPPRGVGEPAAATRPPRPSR